MTPMSRMPSPTWFIRLSGNPISVFTASCGAARRIHSNQSSSGGSQRLISLPTVTTARRSRRTATWWRARSRSARTSAHSGGTARLATHPTCSGRRAGVRAGPRVCARVRSPPSVLTYRRSAARGKLPVATISRNVRVRLTSTLRAATASHRGYAPRVVAAVETVRFDLGDLSA